MGQVAKSCNGNRFIDSSKISETFNVYIQDYTSYGLLRVFSIYNAYCTTIFGPLSVMSVIEFGWGGSLIWFN